MNAITFKHLGCKKFYKTCIYFAMYQSFSYFLKPAIQLIADGPNS
jgi:hypothetical protein